MKAAAAVYLAAIAGLLVMAWALLPGRALGHGEAGWIMANPETAYCCGPSDCERAPPGAVVMVGNAWRVVSTGQLFADDAKDMHWSRDADWWWCRPDGVTVKCLFKPLLGS